MLYVVKNFYFLTDFILGALDGMADVGVITPEPIRRGAVARTWRIAEAFVFRHRRRTIFYGKAYTDKLQSIGPDDAVLFFGEQNLKALLILRKFIAARRVSVWIWNPLADSHHTLRSCRGYARHLREAGLRAFTFDPQDAAQCGLRLAPQVYRRVDEYVDRAAQPDTDLFFVGADKGRLGALAALQQSCREAGLTTYFHIVGDRHTRCATRRLQPASVLQTEKLTYNKTIGWINRSRCLVEILQLDQSGMTVRALEAAFFGKKLITNQTAIRDTPLYHPDNVFLLGADDLGADDEDARDVSARLRDFIARPLHRLEPEVLDHYDIRHWLRQFTTE